MLLKSRSDPEIPRQLQEDRGFLFSLGARATVGSPGVPFPCCSLQINADVGVDSHISEFPSGRNLAAGLCAPAG